ncbi:translation initiation factor eIF3g [Phlyctochytrium arcticum]|nr:translation initiation factor eIF3g [Phlyctochytrium arcticum]
MNWAEDVDDNDYDQDATESTALPAPVVKEEADGTRVTTSYKYNEDGKKVKVVTKTKKRLIKNQVNHAVAERKTQWKKFGEVANLPAGVDTNSTSHGEKVFLKLSSTVKDHDAPPPDEEDLSLKRKMQISGKAKITCRICKGDHWTSKCPFKDTHAPLDEIGGSANADGEEGAGAGGLGAGAGGDDKGLAAGGAGKYVPPSLRNRAPGESMRTDRRDEFPTLRITNLSEEAQEQDIKELVSRFGNTARVFVSRDRETNVCKGFAFVSFYQKEDAERALEKLNGFGYDSLILHVEWARSSRD